MRGCPHRHVAPVLQPCPSLVRRLASKLRSHPLRLPVTSHGAGKYDGMIGAAVLGMNSRIKTPVGPPGSDACWEDEGHHGLLHEEDSCDVVYGAQGGG